MGTFFCKPEQEICTKIVDPTPMHIRRRSSSANIAGGRTEITPHESMEQCENISNAGRDESEGVIDDEDLYKNKQYEIEHRGAPITEFGQKCGIDIDQIGYMLHGVSARDDLFFRLTNNQPVITKKTEIYKFLYALTEMTLKEGAKNEKPATEIIKKLMSLIWKKLPKESGQCSLELTLFIGQFHRILYQVHDEMLMTANESIVEP